MAAKLDQTAEGICGPKWAVARDLTVYETAPATPTMASSRDFTRKRGGGASVVYSDAMAAARFTHEPANYGEYAGAPSECQTFEHGKTFYTGHRENAAPLMRCSQMVLSDSFAYNVIFISSYCRHYLKPDATVSKFVNRAGMVTIAIVLVTYATVKSVEDGFIGSVQLIDERDFVCGKTLIPKKTGDHNFHQASRPRAQINQHGYLSPAARLIPDLA
ncbi:hypothetical protein C8R48DRAFT_670321 [Suillus tomentosus]|nr:hypothetical protein C8R48DRAFT_670321 [Suillus tomentosus]